ncbi:hypothetical protein BJ322DRAFT_1014944 [Thelephora terrestris]|uniref:Uncharacterized protein n=1 Tax=Thelephora terrestris TaxID=56493 RepID=A0A9P6H3B4_9AGAM|nr:hypothetical protein BJ322DRAFT_1014944 [Thelephora terrestris]
MSVPEGAAIPSSLITSLDAAYLFHLLAQDPQKVVAPGKSLLSVLSGINKSSPPESTIEKSVGKTMHQAFWDQALEALSSPSLPSQISRLKGLYKDLHEVLAPLFPSKHPALVAFSLPLPPTTSPLLSAITHLHDVLVALRQRCAPVRDATIDEILHQLDHRSPSASTGELAELLVNGIRSVFALSTDMRNDYSNAVLAKASERELVDMVAMMAEAQERKLVLQLWESEEAMQKRWSRWMEGFQPADPALQVQQKQLWILKLVESLGKPHAVTSQLFGLSRLHEVTNGSDHIDPDASAKRDPEPPNMLPPQFLLSGPTLIRLQNCVQALVIAASLRSLVPAPHTAPNSLPSHSRTADFESPANWTFTQRIWTLLESEIMENDFGPSETKIINLADEVVMTHISALPPGVTTLDRHLEQRLRSTVDRILRTDDPVFILFQKRLLAALSVALLNNPVVEEQLSPAMHSGRPKHQGGVSSPSPPLQCVQKEIPIVAKGFEDPVLSKQCSIAASTLMRTVEWVERVWGDTIS